jgi:hypothetical protein
MPPTAHSAKPQRSLCNNVLGRLYGPDDGKSFEGVIGKNLSKPIPEWAEHGAGRPLCENDADRGVFAFSGGLEQVTSEFGDFDEPTGVQRDGHEEDLGDPGGLRPDEVVPVSGCAGWL